MFVSCRVKPVIDFCECSRNKERESWGCQLKNLQVISQINGSINGRVTALSLGFLSTYILYTLFLSVIVESITTTSSLTFWQFNSLCNCLRVQFWDQHFLIFICCHWEINTGFHTYAADTPLCWDKCSNIIHYNRQNFLIKLRWKYYHVSFFVCPNKTGVEWVNSFLHKWVHIICKYW